MSVPPMHWISIKNGFYQIQNIEDLGQQKLYHITVKFSGSIRRVEIFEILVLGLLRFLSDSKSALRK